MNDKRPREKEEDRSIRFKRKQQLVARSAFDNDVLRGIDNLLSSTTQSPVDQISSFYHRYQHLVFWQSVLGECVH